MKITRELMREWNSPYSDAEIREFIPESGLTAIEVLDLELPSLIRLWIVMHEEVLSAPEIQSLKDKWAIEKSIAKSRSCVDGYYAYEENIGREMWDAIEASYAQIADVRAVLLRS
jgi:hypothetical protein